jgi:hypothetical protein
MRSPIILLLILAGLCLHQALLAQTPTIDIPSSDSLTMLTYGRRSMFLYNAERIIGRKYGLKFRMVAGCMVWDELIDSVDRHNRLVSEKLAGTYGAEWEERFKDEVEREYELQIKVNEIVEDDPLLEAAKDEYDIDWPLYIILSIDGSTRYTVVVYGYEDVDNHMESFQYNVLEADYETGEVRLINNERKLLDYSRYPIW